MRSSAALLLCVAAAALVLLYVSFSKALAVSEGQSDSSLLLGKRVSQPSALLLAERRAEAAEARAAAAEERASAAEAKAARAAQAARESELAGAAAVGRAATAGCQFARLANDLGEQPEQSETNRKLRTAYERVANERKEVMIALTNDVMMCTNRKTCWWNGGNILETFLDQARRVRLTNYVIVTLDDETETFCRNFGGVPSLRLELPVPTAQQNSRGANMISTLKYGLLKQV